MAFCRRGRPSPSVTESEAIMDEEGMDNAKPWGIRRPLYLILNLVERLFIF